MGKDNKVIFSVGGRDYAIIRPNSQKNENATMEYNRVFSKALQNGALLRERLDEFMRQQGLWDDKKEDTYLNLLRTIDESTNTLKQGGIKLTEAKELALTMRGLRGELQSLISEKNSMDVNTAQGQAENARFNFLLITCLVYNDTGDIVFETVDEYLSDSDDNSVSLAAAENFANFYYGLDKDYEKSLPENKFLSKFKFTDGEGRFIDKDGRLTDYNGKLVNEEGRFIDEGGSFIDIDGNMVDEEGSRILDEKPFLNEDGNPVDIDEDGEISIITEDKEEKSKKRRGRPKGIKKPEKEDSDKEKEVPAVNEA